MDACKNKSKCEGGDEIETQALDSDEPVKKSRGGCGAQQPKLTIEGMKMIAEYKIQRKKNDDPEQLPEPVERKQQLSAERVTHSANTSYIFLILSSLRASWPSISVKINILLNSCRCLMS